MRRCASGAHRSGRGCSALTARRWLSVRHTRRADHPVSTADQRDNSLFDAGAVYVFTRKGEHWVQQAYVKASNPRSSAEFGHAVTLSADGNTMVVSAFWEPSNAKGINGDQKDESIPQAGAVYVFTRRGTTWTQQATSRRRTRVKPGPPMRSAMAISSASRSR